MSGPKSGAISVEERLAREIELQRRNNASMLAGAQDEIRRAVSQVRHEVAHCGARSRLFFERCSLIEQKALQTALQVATFGYPSDPDQARRFNDRLVGRLDEVLRQLRISLKPIEDEAGSDYQLQLHADSLRKTIDMIEIDKGEHRVDLHALIAEFERERTESSGQLQGALLLGALEAAEDRLIEIAELLERHLLDSNRAAELYRYAIEIKEALKIYRQEGVLSLLETSMATGNTLMNDARRHIEVTDRLYRSCEASMRRIDELGAVSEVVLKAPYAYGDESELQRVADRLCVEEREACKEAYIVQTVDEVMRERGLNVKKSVVLVGQEGTPGHALYCSTENDIGIHTYFSADGAVMMETASIDQAVLVGEDNAPVLRHKPESTYESLRMMEEQRRFCSIFPELMEALAERGVVLHKSYDAEPSERTAAVMTSTSTLRNDSSDTAASVRKRSAFEGLVEREMRR